MRNLQQLTFSLIVVLVGVGCNDARAVSTETTEAVDKSLAQTVKNFEEAFNARNASGLASLWTEDAVYRSVSSGKEMTGRNAIARAYEELFQQNPNSTLVIQIQSSKIHDNKTATLAAVANVDRPGEAATQSLFNATLVPAGGGWLLNRVEEADLLVDAELNELGWLAGKWSEESPSGRIVHRFRWINDGTFMVRDYWRESSDGPSTKGMQLFGWDPEQSCIRTWLFDSNGSFGEGYWERQGDGSWINKLVVKLPDGRRASTSQVLRRLGDNEITFQSIDREIADEIQPNGPVAKLTRSSDEASPSDHNSTAEGE